MTNDDIFTSLELGRDEDSSLAKSFIRISLQPVYTPLYPLNFFNTKMRRKLSTKAAIRYKADHIIMRKNAILG